MSAKRPKRKFVEQMSLFDLFDGCSIDGAIANLHDIANKYDDKELVLEVNWDDDEGDSLVLNLYEKV